MLKIVKYLGMWMLEGEDGEITSKEKYNLSTE